MVARAVLQTALSFIKFLTHDSNPSTPKMVYAKDVKLRQIDYLIRISKIKNNIEVT